MAAAHAADSNQWKQGLFGCFSDIGLCVYTYFCPCLVAGRNAEVFGESCVLYGIAVFIPIMNCIFGAKTRENVREKYGIIRTKNNDYLVHCFCTLCALTQESTELKEHGDAPKRDIIDRD